MSRVATSIGSITGGDGVAIGETERAGRSRNANSSGAQATARWRQRREQGAVLLTVEVGAEDIEVLVASRWLAAAEAQDRHAVGDAVTRLLGQVFTQLGARAGRA